MKPFKITQRLSDGWMLIDGKPVSSPIQMQFKLTSDTLSPWRADARERFREAMETIGLKREADAILQSLPA